MKEEGFEESIARALESPPGYLARFAQAVARSLAPVVALAPGAPLVIGLSGGKDSSALAVACALCRGVLRGGEAIAVHVEAEEFPVDADSMRDMRRLCASLGMRLLVRRISALDPRTGELGCWRCARERRRVLLEAAVGLGASAVAFAHHLEDAASTALMNLASRGRLETMREVSDFMGIRVVRPMLRVGEEVSALVARRLSLPVVPSPCPRNRTTERERYRTALAMLENLATLAGRRIVKAAWSSVEGGADATEDRWKSTM